MAFRPGKNSQVRRLAKAESTVTELLSILEGCRQRLLVFNLFDLVGEPLDVGAQASPNQLAVMPEPSKIYPG